MIAILLSITLQQQHCETPGLKLKSCSEIVIFENNRQTKENNTTL